jgi:type I restriction enzyme S subunit
LLLSFNNDLAHLIEGTDSASALLDYIIQDRDVLFSWFYWFWILEHLLDFRYIAADKAATMGHTQRLTEAKVVAAPLAVMRSADEIIASIFEKILAIWLESRTLATLQNALLSKLLCGKIRMHAYEG